MLLQVLLTCYSIERWTELQDSTVDEHWSLAIIQIRYAAETKTKTKPRPHVLETNGKSNI